MEGIMEQAIEEFRNRAVRTTESGFAFRKVDFGSIADFGMELQRSGYDLHIGITGQNGMGKSFLMFPLAKAFLGRLGQDTSLLQANEKGRLEFVYAFHIRKYLKDLIKKRSSCLFCIDEAKPFFDYKRSFSPEQIDLYNTIETARSHKNIFLHCCRDYEKLDKNMRNGKLLLLIRIWDKKVDRTQLKNGEYLTEYTFGHVYVGNPTVEMADKFMQDRLNSPSMNVNKFRSERLPTFVGTIKCENVAKYGVTDEEIRLYAENKEKGIQENSGEIKLATKKREKDKEEEWRKW
jgi:hypothetical protein